jgi:hypothetical protein
MPIGARGALDCETVIGMIAAKRAARFETANASPGRYFSNYRYSVSQNFLTPMGYQLTVVRQEA